MTGPLASPRILCFKSVCPTALRSNCLVLWPQVQASAWKRTQTDKDMEQSKSHTAVCLLLTHPRDSLAHVHQHTNKDASSHTGGQKLEIIQCPFTVPCINTLWTIHQRTSATHHSMDEPYKHGGERNKSQRVCIVQFHLYKVPKQRKWNHVVQGCKCGWKNY